MEAKLISLHQDKFKDNYKAVIEVNGITFESVSICRLNAWSQKFGMTEEELKKFIKK